MTTYPYLPALARLDQDAFGDAGKAVLGICLGSQLVARGYGAENIIGRPTEFGWHEVTCTVEGCVRSRSSPLSRSRFPIFHWHSDTFTLPEGAAHLASSTMTAEAGLPHRPRRLRHPVSLRGRHKARRGVDACVPRVRSSKIIAEWLSNYEAHVGARRCGCRCGRPGIGSRLGGTDLTA